MKIGFQCYTIARCDSYEITVGLLRLKSFCVFLALVRVVETPTNAHQRHQRRGELVGCIFSFGKLHESASYKSVTDDGRDEWGECREVHLLVTVMIRDFALSPDELVATT